MKQLNYKDSFDDNSPLKYLEGLWNVKEFINEDEVKATKVVGNITPFTFERIFHLKKENVELV